MSDTLGNGIFVIAAALISSGLTAALQYHLFRKQLERSDRDRVAAKKQEVIAELVAYRFVLTGKNIDAAAVTKFNATLSSIPIFFSDNRDCINHYRAIGDNFTSEKFYLLVIALMRDVPLPDNVIDKHLLENVPGINFSSRASPSP